MSFVKILRRRASVSKAIKGDFLTFTALVDNSSIRLDKFSSPPSINLKYSIDGGNTWITYTWYVNTGHTIKLTNSGDSVKFRGNNNTISRSTAYYKFVMNGTISASGDINTLLEPTGGDIPLQPNCYTRLFENCKALITAPILPSTSLGDYCYRYMFHYCTNLTAVPELPATTLSSSCYSNMFESCTSLTSIPSNLLPATNLVSGCYFSMFKDCTSLTSIPSNLLPAINLKSSCYQAMFRGCTSLTVAPELPATTLSGNCYNSMFRDCIRLNYIKCLATNLYMNSSTQNWVTNVAANGTFIKASSMNSWTTGEGGIPSGWTVENYVEE